MQDERRPIEDFGREGSVFLDRKLSVVENREIVCDGAACDESSLFRLELCQQ